MAAEKLLRCEIKLLPLHTHRRRSTQRENQQHQKIESKNEKYTKFVCEHNAFWLGCLKCVAKVLRENLYKSAFVTTNNE